VSSPRRRDATDSRLGLIRSKYLIYVRCDASGVWNQTCDGGGVHSGLDGRADVVRDVTTPDRRGDNLKGFKGYHLKTKARFLP
jgi:hypothetical protein